MSIWNHEIYKSIDNIDQNQWEHLLDQSESACFYHMTGWLAALEHAKPWEPAHLVIRKKGNPIGLLPSFITSIERTPFSRLVSVNPGYGTPILTGDKESVLQELMQAVENVSTSMLVSHTLRSDHLGHLGLQKQLSETGYRLTVGGKFILPLNTDWEEILANMHRDRRNNIRKGNNSQAEIQERSLTAELDDFYEGYCAKMDELGTTPFPKAFFNELAERTEDNLLLLTVLAESEQRGYHLYLLDEYQNKIRHFIITVTRDDFSYYSGELMHEYAIKWGLQNGWDQYDFGGNNPDFRTGGHQYKSQFGGELYPTYRWEREFSTTFKLGRFISRRI